VDYVLSGTYQQGVDDDARRPCSPRGGLESPGR